MIDAFDGRGNTSISKMVMFKLWKSTAGDWLEVCYCTKLKIRTEDSVRNTHDMKSRADLLSKFGDVQAVDELVRQQAEAGEHMDHPDAPHLLSLRLYYMFHGTEWNNVHSNTKSDELRGKAAMSAEDLCNRSGLHTGFVGERKFLR